MASVFFLHEAFDFTSSNSAIYFLKGRGGGIEVTSDLLFEDADRLIFMLDANCIFQYFMKGLAIASGEPMLELTWDEENGVGDIKQFRPDGTMLLLSFSRFREESKAPHGLFLGGEPPYGDISISKDENTSGFSYYDGNRWVHIWCAANEGFNVLGTMMNLSPSKWEYMGSRAIKNTQKEIILESEHIARFAIGTVRMKRRAFFRAGEDYFILKVGFTNETGREISYNFAYGDEPWVGDFGSSDGDVGWYEGGLIEYEKSLPIDKYGFAGYWDVGNRAADEDFKYAGYANFIEWLDRPTYVLFSNSDSLCCDEGTPLYAKFNRMIEVVWFNKTLKPQETKYHSLAIGMARPDAVTGFPLKPDITVN
jgi:hypothetical protein